MKHLHRHAWPRLGSQKRDVACPFCDSLYTSEPFDEGLEARCQTCGQVLFRNRPQSLERAVAFGLSGAVFLLGLLFLPFMKLERAGQAAQASVWDVFLRLAEEGGEIVALTAFAFVILVPACQVFGLLNLGIPLLFGRLPLGARFWAKSLQHLQHWVMVEVFFLGVLVSLLKLMKLTNVSLEYGFYSMIGLMLSLAAGLGGIDRMELWDRIEVAGARKENESVTGKNQLDEPERA